MIKVIFKGSNTATSYNNHTLLKVGVIYLAELNNDSVGDYYNLYDIKSGIGFDWCYLDEVDILADIREQRINEILND